MIPTSGTAASPVPDVGEGVFDPVRSADATPVRSTSWSPT